MLNKAVCQKARMAKDARFDGQFFIAVKTTKIYCRTICPAVPPKEENVEYFESAIKAASEGYRPCLRCRPDSAPNSPAWKGTDTTLERAISLIEQGALQSGSVEGLAERLGITDRYLRKLFNKGVGVSPKAFALYQQCLFAKRLLHQTQLPITEVALASGFESIRRFNDCFKSQLKLTPSQMRRQSVNPTNTIKLRLNYRPPFNWQKMQAFLALRMIPELEWCDEVSYGRMIEYNGARGYFTATKSDSQYAFDVEISIDDIQSLKPVVYNIKRILDLDTDMNSVEKELSKFESAQFKCIKGLRLPGIWHVFEAGVRAILGQQVSVKAARNLVAKLVLELGQIGERGRYFPTPQAIAQSDLLFLGMPQSRRDTLICFAQHCCDADNLVDPSNWLAIKGIGPWTVDYAKMRGLSEADIFLAGDLGVLKALKTQHNFEPKQASPWQSYLTFQLWSQ